MHWQEPPVATLLLLLVVTTGVLLRLLVVTTGVLLVAPPDGATARPVDGSIRPGHKRFARRLAAICAIAALVLL